MLTDKILTPSQFSIEMLEQSKNPQNQSSYQEHTQRMNSKKNNNEMDFMFEAADRLRETDKKITEFSEALSENFLHQCFGVVFDKIMEAEMCSPHERAIGHSMISKLIKEEGVGSLLSRFQHKNIILSEFARYTDKYRRIVSEETAKKLKVNKIDDDITFNLNKDIAEKFLDDVKDVVPTRVINIIRDRVEDAMKTFIDQNIVNKIAIKDIYIKAKESFDKAQAKDDTIKQENAADARIKANKVYDHPVNVFGAMVKSVAEAVMKTPELKAEYMEDTKLKLEHLSDDVRIMYIVMEMANTLGAINVNEQYISQVLNDLKQA